MGRGGSPSQGVWGVQLSQWVWVPQIGFWGKGRIRGRAVEAADGPAEANRAGECHKQVCTTEGRRDDGQQIFGIQDHRDTMTETELQGPTLSPFFQCHRNSELWT